jgi:hypothetical protein
MSRQRAERGCQGRRTDFVGILRHFLSPEVFRQAHQVAPRQRKDALWVLHPLLMVLVLSCWAVGDKPEDRFEAARAFYVCRIAPKRKRPGATAAGFFLALGRLPLAALRAFAWALRLRISRLFAPFWSVDGFVPFGCDGTCLACPRTEELEGELSHDGGKSDSPPQLWLTALVHLRLGILWSWRLDKPNASERQHLLELLPTLPPGGLVVTDAGYQGYEMMAALMRAGVSSLMRVSSQTPFYLIGGRLGPDGRPEGPVVDKAAWSDGQVYWWTQAARKAGQGPLKVRLMRVSSSTGKSEVWMASDVLEKEKLPLQTAGRFYRMRWQSEGFFRTYKGAMRKVKLCSRTVALAYREAEGSLLGVQVLLAMGAWAVASSPGDKAGFAVCSPAGVLSEIRYEMNQAPGKRKRRGRFLDRLRRAVRDRKPRNSSKVRRPWPKRKDHKPPKPPRLLTMDDALRALLDKYLRHQTQPDR